MAFVTISSESHVGQRKSENQDFSAFHLPEDGHIPKKGILLALADGMGGRPGGAEASRIAINIIMEEYYNDPSGNVLKSLKNVILKANKEVMAKGDEDRNLQGMGTTIMLVVLKRDKMYYANVGDSRGYVINGTQITQISEDHSIVANLVKAGYISEEQAIDYPGGNIITKAIGIDAELKIDIAKNVRKITNNDYIMLCCDGLYREVPEEEILKTINEHIEPDIICKKLVEKANEHGGEDNITVMLAKIDKPAGLLSNLTERVKDMVR